jgi:hypothetical protein
LWQGIAFENEQYTNVKAMHCCDWGTCIASEVGQRAVHYRERLGIFGGLEAKNLEDGILLRCIVVCDGPLTNASLEKDLLTAKPITPSDGWTVYSSRMNN